MGVKFWVFDLALENWQTAQVPLRKMSKRQKYPYGLELSASVRLL